MEWNASAAAAAKAKCGNIKTCRDAELHLKCSFKQLLLVTELHFNLTTLHCAAGSGEAAHFKLFCLQSGVKKRVQCKQGGDRVITRQRRSYRDLKTLANLFSMNPKMLGRQTVQPYHGTIMLFFVGQFCATV